jgi:hypothetical protein
MIVEISGLGEPRPVPLQRTTAPDARLGERHTLGPSAALARERGASAVTGLGVSQGDG